MHIQLQNCSLLINVHRLFCIQAQTVLGVVAPELSSDRRATRAGKKKKLPPQCQRCDATRPKSRRPSSGWLMGLDGNISKSNSVKQTRLQAPTAQTAIDNTAASRPPNLCAPAMYTRRKHTFILDQKKTGLEFKYDLFIHATRQCANRDGRVFIFWSHNVVAYIYLSVPSRTLFMKDISCMRIDERMQSEESCASSANICRLCAHAKCEWQAHANLAQICTIFCARRVLSRVFQGHTAEACVAHYAKYARYYIIHNILFI